MANKLDLLYPTLRELVLELRVGEAGFLPDRLQKLDNLRNYVDDKGNEPVALNFICTHNSRRSHLGMIWGAVASWLAGRDNVATFSGGTEATALNPRMVAALRRAGFHIDDPGGENPRYLISFSDKAPPLLCFSKRYNDPANDAEAFAAIMTCDHADENCPLIHGADLRLPLTYEDPKSADDTPEEEARYDERLRQIGSELLFALG